MHVLDVKNSQDSSNSFANGLSRLACYRSRWKEEGTEKGIDEQNCSMKKIPKMICASPGGEEGKKSRNWVPRYSQEKSSREGDVQQW